MIYTGRPVIYSVIHILTEYLGDDCKIDIEDHINTELYEEALAEATKSYGDEAPDFYEAQQKFFDENDK